MKKLPRMKLETEVIGEVHEAIAAPSGTGWLSPKELHQSGLLYHLNETVLWPLGLAIAVTYDRDTGKYEDFLSLRDFGEVIQDPQPETRAKANQWLAERFKTVKP